MIEGIKGLFGNWDTQGRGVDNSSQEEQLFPLHDEIYDLIFDELDKKSKLQSRASCKKWHFLIEKSHFWGSLFPRYFKNSAIEDKNAFLRTHANLKTETFIYNNNDRLPFYQKYFFNAYPGIAKSPQNKLFRVQGDRIFYPMDQHLCMISRSKPEAVVFAKAHEKPVTALEVGESYVLTAGLDLIEKKSTKKSKLMNTIKVWNADDLSLVTRKKNRSGALCFHAINKTRFLSGHANGMCRFEKICN